MKILYTPLMIVPALDAADRARISRVVITVTGRATVGGQTMTKTLTSEARPRNVP